MVKAHSSSEGLVLKPQVPSFVQKMSHLQNQASVTLAQCESSTKIFLFVVLGLDPRALYMLSTHSTTEPHQVFFSLVTLVNMIWIIG